MTNFTSEMIEKAKAVKTAEELLTLAKENNVEMTEEEAKTYFAQLNPVSGELSENELDNVAGGASKGKEDEERHLLGDGKHKCACGCNEYYKRGSQSLPYYVCCNCGTVVRDPSPFTPTVSFI